MEVERKPQRDVSRGRKCSEGEGDSQCCRELRKMRLGTGVIQQRGSPELQGSVGSKANCRRV